MMIIQINPNANGQHLFQSQSHRQTNWLDEYISVPPQLENVVVSCCGYCSLEIKNGILKNVIPKPELIPVSKEQESPKITYEERLSALESAVLELALGGAE